MWPQLTESITGAGGRLLNSEKRYRQQPAPAAVVLVELITVVVAGSYAVSTVAEGDSIFTYQMLGMSTILTRVRELH